MDNNKSAIGELIHHIIDVFFLWGINLDNYTERRLERLCKVCLSLCNVKTSFAELEEDYYLSSREILKFLNTHLGENISFSSYDDIRRKDINILMQYKIVISKPKSDLTPIKYSLSKDFIYVLKKI